MLAFSEAYSRVYLTLHWFTDIISGLIYGCLILAVFIATIRLVDGPARKVVADREGCRASSRDGVRRGARPSRPDAAVTAHPIPPRPNPGPAAAVSRAPSGAPG